MNAKVSKEEQQEWPSETHLTNKINFKPRE